MNQYPIRCVRTKDWHYILNLEPAAKHTTHIDKAQNKDGLIYWRTWETLAKTDARAAAVVQRYHARPLEELYDVRADPYELRNLAGAPEHQAVRQALAKELRDWRKSQGELQE